MAFAPTSPVTGAAITGLTNPTYTLTSDLAPGPNGKQYAITALGGTQTGVDTHSVSKPFTLTMFKPLSPKALPAPNPITGVVKSIPVNVYKLITRKGAVPLIKQASQVARVTTIIEVPAGTDTYEPEDIKAMLSAHFGTAYANASGIADTVLTGIL